MRRVPSSNPNSPIQREPDRAAFGRLLLVLLISLICTGGFVLAARQHVSAVRLGYRIQELRREREKLIADQDQLRIARERALTPSRLIPEAEKIELQTATVKQNDAPPAAANQPAPAVATQKPVGPKPMPNKPAPDRPDHARR